MGVGDYWYKAKQVVIPLAGLAFLTASTIFLDSKGREMKSRPYETPSFVRDDSEERGITFAERNPDFTFATLCASLYFVGPFALDYFRKKLDNKS